jgi:hypothetical protein
MRYLLLESSASPSLKLCADRELANPTALKMRRRNIRLYAEVFDGACMNVDASSGKAALNSQM